MKFLVAGAAGALALAASTAFANDVVVFDLWHSTEAGRALIAVAGVEEGAPFAVAAGETPEALDLLSAEAGGLVLAGLKAEAEDAGVKIGGDAATEETAHMAGHEMHAQKIILVANAFAETESAPAATRRIIKLRTDEPLDDAAIETMVDRARTEFAHGEENAAIKVEKTLITADDEDAALFNAAGEAETFVLETEENGAEKRLVRVSGASADAARAFIDTAAGLNDEDKAAMKVALGL